MPRNERLAALMTEAGFLDRAGTIGRKRFARAVSDAPSARTTGRIYSHTYVSRWLDGTVPRDDDTRNAIREALGAQLGRVVALDELGFQKAGSVSPDAGLAYPEHPEDSVGSVEQLFDADLASATALTQAPLNVAAWNDAAMAWLVGSQHALDGNGGPVRIGLPDVERLRAMRHTFDRLDSTFGGAHARSALIQYLRTELPRLLRASGTTTVRRCARSSPPVRIRHTGATELVPLSRAKAAEKETPGLKPAEQPCSYVVGHCLRKAPTKRHEQPIPIQWIAVIREGRLKEFAHFPVHLEVSGWSIKFVLDALKDCAKPIRFDQTVDMTGIPTFSATGGLPASFI